MILIIQLSRHAGLLNNGNNLPTSTIYFALSAALNVILTLLIVGRILYYSRTTRNQVKISDCHTFVLAMFVEAAALFAIIGIVLIITLHTNAAASIGVEALYGVMTVCEYQFHRTHLILMQVLSPTLIINRVSAGSACTQDTTQQTTVRHSVSPTAPSCTVLGGSGEGSMKCEANSLDSKPGNLHCKDQVAMEV